MPYGYDVPDEAAQEKHDLLSKMSWDFYQDCISTKKYLGIKHIDVYHFDEPTYLAKFAKFIQKDVKKVNIFK